MEKENRKLIKFSNYSLCVTLPKSTVKILGWEKGDVVKMSVDEKKAEIVISALNKSAKAGNQAPKEKVAKKSTEEPKSRW